MESQTIALVSLVSCDNVYASSKTLRKFMSLLQPQSIHFSCPDKCHVCGNILRACDSAITHDGDVYSTNNGDTSYGGIGLHVECATILAMRLIADVVKHKGSEHEPRVATILLKACKTKLKDI